MQEMMVYWVATPTLAAFDPLKTNNAEKNSFTVVLYNRNNHCSRLST